jgi:hypothetical protein
VVGARTTKPRLFPFQKSLRYCRSLFPGNAIMRGRDKGVEKGRHIQPLVSRDKAPTQKPGHFGPICTTPGNLCLRGTA